MAHPLAGVDAKIDRGFEHLAELEAEVGAFFRDKPYRIVHKPDKKPGWHVAVFRIDREPPIRLGLVAGEAFGQFRSALDHLMSQLIIIRRPQTAGKTHENFPICDERVKFMGASGNGPSSRIRKAVRPAHFALVKSLQPYQPVKRDPTGRLSEQAALALIQWFTNLDKHELVRPGFFAAQTVRIHHDSNISGWDWLMDPETNLQNETRLYRAQFVDKSKMDMSQPMRFTVDLTFGTWHCC